MDNHEAALVLVDRIKNGHRDLSEAEAKLAMTALLAYSVKSNTQMFIDGFLACQKTVQSFRYNNWWGPSATEGMVTGFEMGVNALKEIVDRAAQSVQCMPRSNDREIIFPEDLDADANNQYGREQHD